jgi:hypothetical protein
MAAAQELQVQKKRELESKEETTIPVRQFLPATDIYETENELMVILEMPGVEKSNVSINVEDSVLNVEGRLDEVSGASPALHRIQYRQLLKKLPAFQQDRSAQDCRRNEGWRSVVENAQGRRSKTAHHSSEVTLPSRFAVEGERT